MHKLLLPFYVTTNEAKSQNLVGFSSPYQPCDTAHWHLFLFRIPCPTQQYLNT